MLWRQVAARSGSSQTIPRRGGICCATAWRCLTTAGHWGAPTATRGRQWTLSLLAAIVLICAFGLVLAVTPPRCP